MSETLKTYSIKSSTGLMDAFTVVMDRDELRTNTAVLADARDLIYPIGPQETIVWRLEIIVGGNSPGDAKVGFFTPAAPVSGGFTGMFTAPAAATAVNFGVIAGYNALYAPLETSLAAGDEFVNIFEGRLVNGVNGGYFRLQWAQNAANLTPTKLLAGSRLDVWKLAP